MPGFADKYGPWAVVAGAVDGIGASFCRQLAEAGLNIVLIDLVTARLMRFAAEIEQRYSVETRILSLDLAQHDAVERFQAQTQSLEIGLLVYVACHSVIGSFLDTSVEDKLKMVDVNVRGPLLLVSALAPSMVARGGGGIILMSSLSGSQGTAMVSTYAATKAFDTVLAEGLWNELADSGVDVLAMVAGATHTPTFDQLTPTHKQASVFPMQSDAVAKTAISHLGKGPVAVAGRLNRVVDFIMRRCLPRRVAVNFISRNTKRVYE